MPVPHRQTVPLQPLSAFFRIQTSPWCFLDQVYKESMLVSMESTFTNLGISWVSHAWLNTVARPGTRSNFGRVSLERVPAVLLMVREQI